MRKFHFRNKQSAFHPTMSLGCFILYGNLLTHHDVTCTRQPPFIVQNFNNFISIKDKILTNLLIFYQCYLLSFILMCFFLCYLLFISIQCYS
uniref:Uncharacterized protein n=1 Tax=Ciona savignyi TaxID=51511 RepID=H2ZBN4_CIOSA